jgi:TPR repeat protein
MATSPRDSLTGLVFVFYLLAAAPGPVFAQEDNEPDRAAVFNDETYVKLVAKSYAELEHRLAVHLTAYASGKIQETELASKFAIFAQAYDLDARFDEWVGAYPRSYAARLARGTYRVSDAWRKRGTKYASETTDKQFKEFRDTIEKAAADLEASIPLYSRPVESYRHLIRVSMGLGLGAERGLLDAALKLDPAAYHPREAYLQSLMPNWGGSVSKMNAFLDECKSSRLNDKDKTRIEGVYYSILAGQAWSEKEYEAASEDYVRAYEASKDPGWLYWSGKAALEAGLKQLAFERFDRLIQAHPQYQWGYTQRGYLYETLLNDNAKAFNDYLTAADMGNSWAQNRIGWWYMIGNYVAQDFDRAELYLRRAAAQNNETAITNLKNLKRLRKAKPG